MAICKHEVKAKATGMWDRILLSLAPSIADALEKPGLRHIDCPMHGSTNNFRVFRDVSDSGGGVCTCGTWPDGFGLLSALNGWSFKDTLDEVGRLVLGETPQLSPALAKTFPRKDTAAEDRAIRSRLIAIGKGCIPLSHPAAELGRHYLAGRGLDPYGINLRFHPALAYHHEGVYLGHYAAIVALVESPDGLPVSLHRTYLSSDGRKADVVDPKKLCSHTSDRPLQGTAIRLYPAEKTLAVAEGIETAMAVTQMFHVPCWATITAGLMEKFVPPAGVDSVLIFADKDRPSRNHPAGHGQEASRQLAESMWQKGIKASVRLPPLAIPEGKKGIDWLDCLNQNWHQQRAA